jgi:tryptophan synthase alpha chain
VLKLIVSVAQILAKNGAMSDRIERLFARCRKENRAAFIPYICAGDPNLSRTAELAIALEKAGADLLELGIPFSDPLADGIVNQLAAERALESGVTVKGVLDCVRNIRIHSEIPIVLYTYLNPIFQFGLAEFHRAAATAGVDGLLILDWPPEEDSLDTDTITHIRLIAPTTPTDRIATIAKSARGFIYYVSREGVTGTRESLADKVQERLAAIRQHTDLPITVGFGISDEKQARTVARWADGVVVGSAIVDRIGKVGDSADLADQISKFASPIAAAVHNARG